MPADYVFRLVIPSFERRQDLVLEEMRRSIAWKVHGPLEHCAVEDYHGDNECEYQFIPGGYEYRNVRYSISTLFA